MRKGRTYRKRLVSRTATSKSSTNGNPEIIDLQKWAKVVGYVIRKKIKLTEFSNTGRGVMALENVVKDDVLMQVPFKAIITLFTLESDVDFMDIFFNPDSKNDDKFCCQELLAFYLIYLKLDIKNHQFWASYLNSLPEKFDTPYFHEVPSDLLDDRICSIVSLQKEKIHRSYKSFKNILNRLLKTENSHFVESFTLNLYEWAYFVVNTRCVYIEPDIISEICTLKNACKQNSFLSCISDEPSLGLIPYLDMYNHSSAAKTSAVLKLPKSINCNEPNLHFELATLSNFKKYEEIFISYGSHCNVKLFTEYGFSIPNNPFSNLALDFDDVCKFIKGNALSISKEKYNFIMQHKLNRDLFITSEGFNFNFTRLLFILTNDYKTEWNMKIFSNKFNEIEHEKIDELGKKMLYEKKMYFLNKLKKIDQSKLHVNVDIINENINLIENILNTVK